MSCNCKDCPGSEHCEKGDQCKCKSQKQCDGQCANCAQNTQCSESKCDGQCSQCPSKDQCQKSQNQELQPQNQQQSAQNQQGCAPDKCANCPSRGKCGTQQAEPTEQNLRIAATLKHFQRIFLILSGKGGVGKSTVATQLAFYLADNCNKQVALLDLDVCGPSIPTMTCTVGAEVVAVDGFLQPVTVTPNLQTISIGFMLNSKDDAVIMRGPKKHGLIAQFLADINWQAQENGILIVDTPPGTTDEHLSVVQLIQQCQQLNEHKCDLQAIIVSTPQEVALSDVRKELNFCSKLNIPVKGVIENMSGFVCPSCKTETQIFVPTSGGVQKMCNEFNVAHLGRIPLDQVLVKAGEEGVPWGALTEESVGLDMFMDIVAKILQ